MVWVSALLAPARLIGSAFGGGWGIFSGAERGQSKADQQANQQTRGGLAQARGSAQGLHRQRLRLLPQGPIQPGRDAAGRSRNRRHRSRPRTVALRRSRLQHRRNNHDRALPLPLLGRIANHRLAADELHVGRIHQARGERDARCPSRRGRPCRRARCRSRRQICRCPRSSTRRCTIRRWTATTRSLTAG